MLVYKGNIWCVWGRLGDSYPSESVIPFVVCVFVFGWGAGWALPVLEVTTKKSPTEENFAFKPRNYWNDFDQKWSRSVQPAAVSSKSGTWDFWKSKSAEKMSLNTCSVPEYLLSDTTQKCGEDKSLIFKFIHETTTKT